MVGTLWSKIKIAVNSEFLWRDFKNFALSLEYSTLEGENGLKEKAK